jgi:hypothetical protein
MSKIIGISGYAGAGKDTAGLALLKLGYVKRSFADPLRETCSIITGVSLDIFNDPVLKNVPRDDLYGKTPRQVLQLIGTEGWRDLIGVNTWIDNFIRYANNYKGIGVYSSDVRFINEALAIKKANGILIHIDKPGKDSHEFNHQSEMEISEVRKMADVIINNDSNIDNLHNEIFKIIS